MEKPQYWKAIDFFKETRGRLNFLRFSELVKTKSFIQPI